MINFDFNGFQESRPRFGMPRLKMRQFAIGQFYKKGDYVLINGAGWYIAKSNEFVATAEPKDDSANWVEVRFRGRCRSLACAKLRL